MLACYLNYPANVFSSEKNKSLIIFSEQKKVPHYFFLRIQCLMISSEKICLLIFSEEIMWHFVFCKRSNEASWVITSIILKMLFLLKKIKVCLSSPAKK
jgi:hypothetical protein